MVLLNQLVSMRSLFAAQAGASTVNAVEASEKMASVASQIANDNGLIESGQIEPHSVDVLVSEWMGYCLLYETMLSYVLVARDHWLKPGGAMLQDLPAIKMPRTLVHMLEEIWRI
nr:probable protein arginine N-methyltransferase 3 [Tanacetum cinerariifolium]